MNNFVQNVVVRYVVSLANGKKDEILGVFHTKTAANRFYHRLSKKERKHATINQHVFDGSKIQYNMNLKYPSGKYIAYHFVRFGKHYFFDVGLFDFPFEVGMAIDWLNGIRTSVVLDETSANLHESKNDNLEVSIDEWY